MNETVKISFMSKSAFLPVLRVSGTNYEIGYEIGSKFKDRIKRAFSQNKRWDQIKEADRLNPERLDALLKPAEKAFPQYMEELLGIAEGCDIDYREILLRNFADFYPREGCSTLIFKTRKRIILAHNEDGGKNDIENAYLIIAQLKEGTSFFAHCYPGRLPGYSFSFNSHGIVMSANSVPTPDLKIGVPRSLLDRSMVEGKTIEDTIQRALLTQRSGGFSYNLASMKEKRAVNLETTSEKHFVTEVQDKYFHTNHYISEGLISVPAYPGPHRTVERYKRGIELLSQTTRKSSRRALDILSDAKIFMPASSERELCTLCTALFEISDDIILKLYPPKQEKVEFMRFTLKDLE